MTEVPSTALRRQPKQQRSRERIDAILATAMQLIGEKGIDAVAMRDIAARSGRPMASIYQYFPNKSAILATLHQHFSEASRARIDEIVSGIGGLDDMIAATDRLLDDYVGRVAGDPAIQDLQNAIQADKTLQNLEMIETRRQAEMFCRQALPLVAPDRREAFARMVFLVFHLGTGVVRLALSQDEAERRRTLDDYKAIIHGQLRAFLD